MILPANDFFDSMLVTSKTLAKPPLPNILPLEYFRTEISPFILEIFSSMIIPVSPLSILRKNKIVKNWKKFEKAEKVEKATKRSPHDETKKYLVLVERRVLLRMVSLASMGEGEMAYGCVYNL